MVYFNFFLLEFACRKIDTILWERKEPEYRLNDPSPRDAVKPMILFILILFFAFVVPSVAADAWFADTRPGTVALSRLAANEWEEASGREFFETFDSSVPLVVVIHGNWMSLSEAKHYGKMFHALSRSIGSHRLLVWSWPSERLNGRVRRDAQIKAVRADAQAEHLTAFLYSLPADSKVSLVGFSFGAKLVCNTLQQCADHSLQIRTVLLAAGIDQASLQPGRQYGNALFATEAMLVHINRLDSKLRFYPLLYGCGGPEAVGKDGVSRYGMSAESRAKIKSVDVSRLIGGEHGFMDSLRAFLACRSDFKHYSLFLD